MPARLAVLGTGIWATLFHIPALLASEDIELVGIWARSDKSAQNALNSDALKDLSQKPDLYIGDEGLDQLLGNANIDGVVVALPITAQPDIVIKALRAGKHVLSEKPVHKDVESAIQLIETYEKEFKPKGLIWRVAENFAHDSTINEAAKIVQKPELGPVLYWQLQQQSRVAAGSMFHATAWRNVPDYQGGFVLDGGVHLPAMLRHILPIPPASIISTASLHRTHLPPIDTVMGIARPPPEAVKPAYGPDFGDISKIPVPSGKSGPTGTITLSWAQPDAVKEGALDCSLEVTCLNGIVYVERTGLSWTITVKGTKDSGVEEKVVRGDHDGVKVQAGFFARAITGSSEPNPGDPRSALWDLRFIQAMLTSDGKEIQLGASPPQVIF